MPPNRPRLTPLWSREDQGGSTRGIDLDALWLRLTAVHAVQVRARSFDRSPRLDGEGRASVATEQLAPNQVVFHERGSWTMESGSTHLFSNVYRWTALWKRNVLRLEHLRQGPERPVFLVDFTGSSDPAGAGVLRADAPHRCGADLYDAAMFFPSRAQELNGGEEWPGLGLAWKVKGPTKGYELQAWYQLRG